MTIAYLNGELIPLSEAKISVMDRGFLFGDGVYEVISAYAGKLFLLEQHYLRLKYSLEAIKLDIPISLNDYQNICNQLLIANGEGDQVIYLQITRGVSLKRHHEFPAQIQPTVFGYTWPLTVKSIVELSAGHTAITVPDIRWQRCDIKAISLLGNVLSKQQAIEAGVNDAILIRDGFAIEGAASSLFIVKDNVLFTPLKSSVMLNGITQDFILEIAAEEKFPFKRMNISEAMLHDADEIWLTNSTGEIIPIVELNGKKINQGQAGPVWLKMISWYRAKRNSL